MTSLGTWCSFFKNFRNAELHGKLYFFVSTTRGLVINKVEDNSVCFIRHLFCDQLLQVYNVFNQTEKMHSTSPDFVYLAIIVIELMLLYQGHLQMCLFTIFISLCIVYLSLNISCNAHINTSMLKHKKTCLILPP